MFTYVNREDSMNDRIAFEMIRKEFAEKRVSFP